MLTIGPLKLALGSLMLPLGALGTGLDERSVLVAPTQPMGGESFVGPFPKS